MKVYNTKKEAIAAIKAYAEIMKKASEETGADFVADACDDTGMEYYVEACYHGKTKTKIVLGKEKTVQMVEEVRIHFQELGL
jgi:hypothetical protein